MPVKFSILALLVVLAVGGLVIAGIVGLVVWLLVRRKARPQGFPVEPPAQERMR